MKTKAAKASAKAPRLEGEALRDELMLREAREEARVLAVNSLFYRARAYNVSGGRCPTVCFGRQCERACGCFCGFAIFFPLFNSRAI